MEEQLIDLETAKLAKEKGFDLNDYTSIHYVYDPLNNNNLIEIDIDANILIGTDDYLAPTQSLLQKWLRQKHGWDVCIEMNYNWRGRNKDIGSSTIGNVTDTYENALEQFLKEALITIKS